jgi:hypothetical protein
VLLIMGAFTPWALLRLLPLAEVASSAVGSLSREMRGGARPGADLADLVTGSAPDWTAAMTARLRKEALGATPSPPPAQDAHPIVEAIPVTPQGGEGVASQGSDDAPLGAEETPQPSADSAPESPATYETHDVGIDEMWKPEHRGKWAR